MSLLDNALELVRQGFAVFPLVPNAKDPLTDHGFKDASRDEERVRSWWNKTRKPISELRQDTILTIWL